MPRPRSRFWSGAAASMVFLATEQLPLVVRWLGLRRLMPWPLVLGLRNLMEITLCAIGVAVVHRTGPRRALAELGLRAPIGRAMLFAMLATAPMLITFAVRFPVSSTLAPLDILAFCFIAPFAEELVFRGYLFRQLYRHARMGFWLSALIPSLLFAAAHLYQSDDPGELVGIVLITGAGSVLGCWLFVRWQDNVWPLVGLHSLMNLWWAVFAVDNTALGGWLANAARLATVAVAIMLTIYKDRLWKPAAPPSTATGPAPSSVDRDVLRTAAGLADNDRRAQERSSNAGTTRTVTPRDPIGLSSHAIA